MQPLKQVSNEFGYTSNNNLSPSEKIEIVHLYQVKNHMWNNLTF